MAGYFREPEGTRAVVRNGWLHTGDIGRFDANGFLHIDDRRIDLIVTGGENVYPAEVEAVLTSHPLVAEAAVYPRAILTGDIAWRLLLFCATARTSANRTFARGAGFASPGSKSPSQSDSWMRCRAPRPAKSNAACCETRNTRTDRSLPHELRKGHRRAPL